MDSNLRSAAVVEPPRGTFSARVDDKGRLKLPVEIQAYVESFGTKKVFITTLDTATAKIYPISEWKANEILLDGEMDSPEDAEDIALVANHFGADAEMDAQGRLLVPTDLRRHLGIEDQQVWLDVYKNVINVYSREVYEQRKARALAGLADKVKKFKGKGLK